METPQPDPHNLATSTPIANAQPEIQNQVVGDVENPTPKPATTQAQPKQTPALSSNDVLLHNKDGDKIDDEVDEPEFTRLLYFGDDYKDKELKDQADRNCQYYEHEYSLNLWYFLEAFVLHILHMTLLGPWTFGLGIVYPKYLVLMKNMEFFSCSYPFWITMIIWVTNMLVFFGYWYYEYDSFNVGFICLAGVAILTRAANIASKYATFSPRYRRRLMNYDLSRYERERYFLLGGWGDQQLTFAEDEILNAMLRQNIDDSTFKLSFIVKPSEHVEDLLSDIKCMNQRTGETNTDTSFGSSMYYDCKGLLYGLIKDHMGDDRGDYVFMVSIIAGFIWGLTPGYGRVVRNRFFYGEDEIEIIVWFLGMIVYSMLMILICVFFVTAYFDNARIVDMMEQLSQMYSPDKILNIEEKLFPTINLADAISLQGWMNMRNIILDYGARYTNRHKIFYSIILAFLVSCSFGIFTFDIFEIDISSQEKTVVQTVLFGTVIIYGAMFVALTRLGQRINDQTKNHIELIMENQQIFQSFHHFRDYYVREGDKEMPFDVTQIFDKEVNSTIHKKMAEEFKRLLGDNHKVCNEYIEKLVGMQEEFLTEIRNDYTSSCRTLLGFPINYAITGLVFVAYVAVLIYGFSVTFQKYL